MNFCSTENQIANIFTKALNRELFERNRLELGWIKIAWFFLINPQWLVREETGYETGGTLVCEQQLSAEDQHMSDWQLVDSCWGLMKVPLLSKNTGDQAARTGVTNRYATACQIWTNW